jgi:hypothetical protein
LTAHTWRAALVTVGALLAIEPGAIAADPADFDPEQGAVVDGAYLNPYFRMRYPLPEGWKPGPQPARPSYGGYYVLSTPAPPENTRATILIAAQDNFFADKPISDAKATVANLAHSVQEGAAEAEISSTTIAGHTFARLNIEARPLSRVVFATKHPLPRGDLRVYQRRPRSAGSARGRSRAPVALDSFDRASLRQGLRHAANRPTEGRTDH